MRLNHVIVMVSPSLKDACDDSVVTSGPCATPLITTPLATDALTAVGRRSAPPASIVLVGANISRNDESSDVVYLYSCIAPASWVGQRRLRVMFT